MDAETNAADSEVGALRDLIQSEGWRLFRAKLAEEWGPAGYGRQLQAALAKIPPGPDQPYELSHTVQLVTATAAAVNQLVKWPEEQLGRIAPKAPHGTALDRLRRIAR